MSEDYAAPEVVEVAPARGRRGLVVGIGATVLAVTAGAVVWATTTLSGGGRQPDEVVPKTTFAYVKLDLDPAANQKLAVRSYFSKIPSLKDKVSGSETDDVFDDLLAEALTDDDLDYRRDVKPWFDKRAAVAAFSDGSQNYVVAALRSKDDALAKTSLDKVDDVAYRITNGYAIVGDEPAVAAAVRLAATESLHDNTTYRDDVERLDGDQVAVGWTEAGKAAGVLAGGFDVTGMIPPAVLNGVAKGRVVAGLHFTGDTAEVQGKLIDTGDPGVDPAIGQDLLTGLPADTAVAVSVNGLGKAIKQQTAGLPLDRFAGDWLEGTGLSITGDLLPLFMRQTVLAAAPFGGLDDLRAGLVSKVADPTNAAASAKKVEALLQLGLGIPATATVEGDKFVLAMPETYGAELAKGGGGLGAKPSFTRTMGDLTGASGAIYVDVSALDKPWFFAGAPKGTTFGAVGGYRDGEGFFRLRLVIAG